MMAYRLLRLLAHLFVGLWKSAFIFPLLDPAGRDLRVRRWSTQLLAICRVQLAVRNTHGSAEAVRALIVANHVSWLDIFVINTLQPCRFVAKSDIRDWPLIGWLCEKAGTIFLARGRQRDVRRIYQGLVTSIHDGERVAFFPEGTTGSQGALLPFHANLLQAAIDAEVPIQPYALRYVDASGGLHPAADFIGDMTFAASVIAILKGGPMTAELILLPPIDTDGGHRRALASAARQSIAAALECDDVQSSPGR